jgi:hypothetical protein
MRLRVFLAGLMVALSCAPARSEMTVFTADALLRIRPDDPPAIASSIVIRAARNEYEPFQVIVHAGSATLAGVSATASDLRSHGGSVIDASNITFYREQYVRIATPSPRSSEGKGWYPDALIPFARPAGSSTSAKPRFAGAPFAVDAGTNQPIWIDVYVPKDAAPGDYSGIVTVSADHEKPVQIAVQLTVWDITLPDTPSMRSNFGKLGTDIAKAHGVVMNSVAFQTPEWNYAVELAAHRISPIIPNTLYPEVRDDGSIDYARTDAGLKKWMTTFHVTGFPIRLLGDDPTGRDRARNVAHLRAMYAYLKSNGWEKTAYVYALDEPNSAHDYDEVRRRAKLIHDVQPGIKVMCTEQPVPEKKGWGTLVGSVDIWVPLWTLWDDASIGERERAGDEVWSYTALCQGRKSDDTPYWEIDFPLLDFRIPMWISWSCGATGLLYWSPVNWGGTHDMWTDPGTLRAHGQTYNGEGALFYPGTAAGIDGPVVSMRLKQIREGFEDYEYLKLLADKGDSAFANEIVHTIARSWSDWDSDSQALYEAREKIARRLTFGK